MSSVEWLVVAGAAVTITWVNWYFFAAGRSAVRAAPVAVGTAAGSVPELVITVDNGYAPNAIRVKAGERTRLLFDRKDDSSCSEEVVFADFGIRKYLPTGERTAIDITPPAAGRYTFTCGMGMLRGTVIADD